MDKVPESDTILAPAAPVATPAAEMDLTGMTLGDFKIRRRLGGGGMGQVYLAEQISLKREVALKTLRTDLAANRQSLERFDAEAKAVAKATHANIVQIYVIERAQVQNQTVHYLALEYIDGRNLRELLEKKGSPDLLMGLSIMQQVASALQRASELGIIHRDIKPENILISRQGEVKVADFGLSRCFDAESKPLSLTQTGVTMGTPLYMSPEQVELRAVDPRTDIYSLGVTCYHMWAGQPPFRGTSPFEIAAQHVQKEPPSLVDIRPDLPIELCTLIQRMMAKKPEDRPQTSREIVREVMRLRDMVVGASVSGMASGADLADSSVNLPAANAPPDLGSRPQTSLSRLPRLLLGSLIVMSVLGACIGVGLGGSYVYRHYVTKSSPPSIDKEQPPVRNTQAEDLEKEKDLVRTWKKYWPPRETGDVRHTLDLGIFYLEKGKFDEAESLFKDLSNDRELSETGRLGIAMVLALRGDANQSNQKFKEVLTRDKKEKLRDDLANYWRNYPPWRKMMATALYHNKANLPAAVGPFWMRRSPFPRMLEEWLRAPGPTSKAAVKG